MASIAATARAVEASKVSSTYERFAGICAMLAGGLTLVWLGVSLWRGARS